MTDAVTWTEVDEATAVIAYASTGPYYTDPCPSCGKPHYHYLMRDTDIHGPYWYWYGCPR